MAVKWAVANNVNWNVGSTWNDGIVPADGDYVYLNGKRVNYSGTFIFDGTISNEANDDIGVNSGGYLDVYEYNAGTTTQVTTFIAATQILHLRHGTSTTRTENVVFGDFFVKFSGSAAIINTMNFLITGNVHLEVGGSYLLQTSGAVTINGNITSVTGGVISTLTLSNLKVNGNVESSVYASTAIIYGNINASLNNTVNANDLTIFGNITYLNDKGGLGVRCASLTVTNPDTFTWKDITVPRVNQFIIVTDADMNNHQQYPTENEVKEGTEYVWGEKVGTYQQPPESVVLKGYRYDNDEKEGTLENQNIVGCVTPEDVRKDVPLVGMGVVGSLVVPSVDDVREGVVFDNGSVGTLIVQGGGDRLRIADFGYYTRSTSITYIVDLTESDKPAFAVCEEIVLLSLFPTLDLDNIPDKFFDDLFIQFLRYRLLVEYYRGTSINSKFTPSEPTTEIVNYANTKCEYWLNTANLFLQLWGEKYPNSVKKDRILL